MVKSTANENIFVNENVKFISSKKIIKKQNHSTIGAWYLCQLIGKDGYYKALYEKQLQESTS